MVNMMPDLIKPKLKPEKNREDIVNNQVQLVFYKIQESKNSDSSVETLKNKFLEYKDHAGRSLKPDAIKQVLNSYSLDNAHKEMLEELLVIRSMGRPKIGRTLNLREEIKNEQEDVLYKLVYKAPTKVELDGKKSTIFVQKTEPREIQYGSTSKGGIEREVTEESGELFCEYLGSQVARHLWGETSSPKVRLHKNKEEVTILSEYKDFETIATNPDKYFNFIEDNKKLPEWFGKFFAVNKLLGNYDLTSGNFGVMDSVDGSQFIVGIDYGRAWSFNKVPEWTMPYAVRTLEQTAENLKSSLMQLRVSSEDRRLLFPERLWHGIDFVIGINNIISKRFNEKHIKVILSHSLEHAKEVWGEKYLNSKNIIDNFRDRNGLDCSPMNEEIVISTIMDSMNKAKKSLEDMAQKEAILVINQAIDENNKDIIKRLYLEVPEVFKKFISEYNRDSIENLELSLTNVGIIPSNSLESDAIEPEIDSSFISSRRDIIFNEEESSSSLNIAFDKEETILEAPSLSSKTIFSEGLERIATSTTNSDQFLDRQRSDTINPDAEGQTVPIGYIELLKYLKQLLLFESNKEDGFIRIERDVSKVLENVPDEELQELRDAVLQDPKINYLFYRALKEKVSSNGREYIYEQLNKILERRDFTLSKKDIETLKKDSLQRVKAVHQHGFVRYDSSEVTLSNEEKLFEDFSRNIYFLHANDNEVRTVFKIIFRLKSLSEQDLKYLAFHVMSDININPLKDGYSVATIRNNKDVIFENSKDTLLTILTHMLLQRTPPISSEVIEENIKTVQAADLKNSRPLSDETLSDEDYLTNDEGFINLQRNIDLLLCNKGFKIILGKDSKEALKDIPLEALKALAFLLMKDSSINTLSSWNSFHWEKIKYDNIVAMKAQEIYTMLNTMLSGRDYILPKETLGLMINKIFNDIYADFTSLNEYFKVELYVIVLDDIFQVEKQVGKVTDSTGMSLTLNSFIGVVTKATSQSFDEDTHAELAQGVPNHAANILQAFTSYRKIYSEVTITSLIDCFNSAPSTNMASATARLVKILDLAKEYNSIVDLRKVDLSAVDFISIQGRNQDIIKAKVTYQQENRFDDSLLKQKYAKVIEAVQKIDVIGLGSLLSDYENIRPESKIANIVLMHAFDHERYDLISFLINSKRASLIYFLKSEFTGLFNKQNLENVYEDLITEIETVSAECVYNNAQLTLGIEKILHILADIGGDQALNVMKALQDGDVYFQATDKFNQNALEIACLAGHYEIARYLLSLLKPASETADPLYDVNKKVKGKTLVERVVEKITPNGEHSNYIEILQALKEYRSVINLKIAVILKDKEYIEKLLQACKIKDTLAANIILGKKERYDVSEWRIEDIMELKSKTNLPLFLNTSYLKIIHAILFLSGQFGWIEQVQELLDRDGIDINLRSDEQMRLLDYACSSGNEKLLNLVINHPKFKSSHLDESLGGASWAPPTIIPIISYEYNRAVQTECIPPALLIAINNKHWHIVKVLLKADANPNTLYEGETILEHALKIIDYKNEEQLGILVDLSLKSVGKKAVPNIVGEYPSISDIIAKFHLDTSLSPEGRDLLKKAEEILKERIIKLETEECMDDILKKIDNNIKAEEARQEILLKNLVKMISPNGEVRSTVVERASDAIEMPSCVASRDNEINGMIVEELSPSERVVINILNTGETAGRQHSFIKEEKLTGWSRLLNALNMFHHPKEARSDYSIDNSNRDAAESPNGWRRSLNTDDSVEPPSIWRWLRDRFNPYDTADNLKESPIYIGGNNADNYNEQLSHPGDNNADNPSEQSSAQSTNPEGDNIVRIPISNSLANPVKAITTSFVQDEIIYIEFTIPSFNSKKPSSVADDKADAHAAEGDYSATPINPLLVGSFVAKEAIESLPTIKSFLNIYTIDISWLGPQSFWNNAHLVVTYIGSISVGLLDPTKAVITNEIYKAKQNLRTELLENYHNGKDETINNLIDFGEKCGSYIAKQALLGGATSGSLDIILVFGAFNNALSSGLECYNLYNKSPENNKDSILHQGAKYIAYPTLMHYSFQNTDFSNSFNIMSSCKQMISTMNAIVIADQLMGESVNDVH